MKKYVYVALAALLSVGCNKKNNDAQQNGSIVGSRDSIEQPKGEWKVDKQFDERGNLIRYDSIYSWSSSGDAIDFSTLDKDSLLQSFKSRFYTDFPGFNHQGFDDVFANDSLFSQRYFNDGFFESEFGKDFMDLDHIRQRMIDRQRKFLEKYRSEFATPENGN